MGRTWRADPQSRRHTKAPTGEADTPLDAAAAHGRTEYGTSRSRSAETVVLCGELGGSLVNYDISASGLAVV